MTRTIKNATIIEIKSLVKTYLKNNAEGDFLLWMLDEANPHREVFLQAAGINKLAELSEALLSNAFSLEELEKLAPYLSALNAFFFFEIISDNLAIGLASPKVSDKSWKLRKEILLFFNEIMCQKLEGKASPAIKLLAERAFKINKLSSFAHSLVPSKIKKLHELYALNFPQQNHDKLNHSTLELLALNIEACLNTKNLISNSLVFSFFIQSLSKRYSAVSKLLLRKKQINLATLLNIGTQTILVMPVLTFIAAAINQVQPSENWPLIINEGLLFEAIEIASRLIRISNDMGTHLLDPESHLFILFKNEIIKNIKHYRTFKPRYSFLNILENMARSSMFSTTLARIRKDIVHGEYNIVLDNVRKMKNPNKMLTVFLNNIYFYSDIYQRDRVHLMILLDELTARLNNNAISQCILKMVTFHEELYKYNFEEKSGEFAIH